ncbi:MAG: site-specific DNA-methyltransferase, partial [Aggregatibacter sp.]|uniref:site-specific DNA-methyltransferase n=1 Tax=Aggregatibacter sp. TaxID=1872413 RepID=UPI003622A01B
KLYGGKNDAKWFAHYHDYILTYAKNKLSWYPNLLARSEKQNERYKNPDNDPRGPWKSGDFTQFGPTPNCVYEIETPNGTKYFPPEGKRWITTHDKYLILRADNRLWFGKDGGNVPSQKRYLSEVKQGVTQSTFLDYEDVGHSDEANKELKNIFDGKFFDYPKPTRLLQRLVYLGSNANDTILDYFAGSGTTAHAVINLNREDNGNRKYILVEQGEYFDTVLKPRVQKVIFAKDWKDGKPQSDNGVFGGVSQIVKVLKLESYEDTLNNLELRKPIQDLADMGLSETVQNDYLLHYMLDVESRDSLLNTQHFTKPFDYQLNIATTSAGAYEAKTIDLVETFNYLIGLRVSEINDKRENGLVTVQGINTSGEKTLVIWRDCEKYDYDKLNRYLDSRDINPQDSEFEVVYINGDHNVPTVFTDSDDSVKTLKVRSIESEFLSRMFG